MYCKCNLMPNVLVAGLEHPLLLITYRSKTTDMLYDLFNFIMEISWGGPCTVSYFLPDGCSKQV